MIFATKTFKKHFVSLTLLLIAWLADAQSDVSDVSDVSQIPIYPVDMHVYKNDGETDTWIDGSIIDYDEFTQKYEVRWLDFSTDWVDEDTVGSYVRNEDLFLQDSMLEDGSEAGLLKQMEEEMEFERQQLELEEEEEMQEEMDEEMQQEFVEEFEE
eukprot:jgi/Psemu1/300323/fgenesh1_kg.10_\